MDIDLLNQQIEEIQNSDFTYMINILLTHNIHPSWYDLFISTYTKLVPIMKDIDKLRENGIIIYPPNENIFFVFTKDIATIKIVLLGQDPYIKANQAMGLSFSVNDNIAIPPSLLNIYKELKIEFPERNYQFSSGNLTGWFNKGIFLLNSALTVIEGKSNSQQELWAWFTDLAIKYIDKRKHNMVFLLLGNNAISKKRLITNNSIITAVHPSPLSAYNGFFNSNIFKDIEKILGERFDWLL